MKMLLILIACAMVLGTSCSTTPRSPDRSDENYRELEYRVAHQPYGSFRIGTFRDRRPAYELGRENYLNDSYYSEELFERSVVSTFRSVMEREIVTSGLFSLANKDEEEDYRLDIWIDHFYAKGDRDLVGILPVVPSIDVESRITFRAFLTDPDGRRFLERRFDGRRESTIATIEGVTGTGADLLLEVLGELMDEFLTTADASVTSFWRDLGFDPLNPPEF